MVAVPWWYVLLAALTLGALVALAMPSAGRRERRPVLALLAGLVLVETGLVLLVWSRLACWTLVSAGVALAASHAPRAQRRSSLAVSLAAAAGLGLWFQFAPAPLAFHVYLAGALPLALAAAALPLAAGFLRWGTTAPALGFTAALALFVGFVPASMFGPEFLRVFELWHAPLLLVLLLAAGWLATIGLRAVRARRARVVGAMDLHTYLAREGPVRPGRIGALGGAGALVLAAVLVQAAAAGLVELWPAIGVAVVALAAGAHALAARSDVALAERSSWFVVAAGLVLAVLLARNVVPGLLPPAPTRAVLYGLGLALALALSTTALAMARRLDLEARAAAEASEAERLAGTLVLPPGTLVVEGGDAPTPARLEAARAQALRTGHASVVVPVVAPPGELLWTLDDASYAWLAEQDDLAARVHVAVLDGGSHFLVPPLLTEEHEP